MILVKLYKGRKQDLTTISNTLSAFRHFYLENFCCSETICARPSSDSSVTSRRRFSLSSRKRRSSSSSWISFSRCGHKNKNRYLSAARGLKAQKIIPHQPYVICLFMVQVPDSLTAPGMPFLLLTLTSDPAWKRVSENRKHEHQNISIQSPQTSSFCLISNTGHPG